MYCIVILEQCNIIMDMVGGGKMVGVGLNHMINHGGGGGRRSEAAARTHYLPPSLTAYPHHRLL